MVVDRPHVFEQSTVTAGARYSTLGEETGTPAGRRLGLELTFTGNPAAASAGILSRMRSVVHALNELAQVMLDEDYSEDFQRPSLAAYRFAWAIVSQAYEVTAPGTPLPSVSTTGDGSLTVQWNQSPAKFVRMRVSPNAASAHLYYRDGEQDGGVDAPTAEKLASRLRWLVSA